MISVITINGRGIFPILLHNNYATGVGWEGDAWDGGWEGDAWDGEKGAPHAR